VRKSYKHENYLFQQKNKQSMFFSNILLDGYIKKKIPSTKADNDTYTYIIPVVEIFRYLQKERLNFLWFLNLRCRYEPQK
jgi:hypothetical protein